jgi:hypothetical protein
VVLSTFNALQAAEDQRADSRLQSVHWIGLAEFDDPGLKVGKKDDCVLGDDP